MDYHIIYNLHLHYYSINTLNMLEVKSETEQWFLNIQR